MDNYKNKSIVAGGCLLVAGWAGAASGETSFSPRINVSAVWTDNYLLVGSAEPRQDELIGQVIPGFRYVYEAPRLQAFADYDMQVLYSKESEDSSEVFHQGQLGLVAQAVPEWLFVELAGAYQQNVVDPTEARNIDNLFLIGNTADSAHGRITPVLTHAFRHVRIDAAYTYGVVNYAGVDFIDRALADTTSHNATFAVGSSDPESTLTWSTSYRRERTEYDEVSPFKHELAHAELGVRVAPTLRLLARGGLESDPLEGISEGGLDESFWQGGFLWRRDEQDQFQFLYGERFFGTTYEAMWQRTGRFLNWDVSYTEEPTTEAQELVARITPGPDDEGLPPDRAFDRLTSDVYVLKRLGGRIAAKGRVTEIALNVRSDRREYVLLSGLEDDSRGATLVITRQLGPRVTAEAQVGTDEIELREGTEYDEQLYSLRFSRRMGSRSTLNLTFSHNERSSLTLAEYGVNWVVLGIQASF